MSRLRRWLIGCVIINRGFRGFDINHNVIEALSKPERNVIAQQRMSAALGENTHVAIAAQSHGVALRNAGRSANIGFGSAPYNEPHGARNDSWHRPAAYRRRARNCYSP